MEFISGNKRTWNDFQRQIPEPVRPMFEDIREFCMNLGENVVEDVRMHRIVFGKSMTFRWFADIEPDKDGIIIKIQKDRKEQPKIIQVKSKDDISESNKLIKEAYEKIH
ncbi:MAG: DUF5655 domain-containing protein [Nitrosopumilaceae archaeon]|nr:DUF5655 domain-containing protein [Nitrosopumilaceae archaeon]